MSFPTLWPSLKRYPALPHGLYPSLFEPGTTGQLGSRQRTVGETEVGQPKGGAATVSQPRQGAFEIKT